MMPTENPERAPRGESFLLRVSIRAWLALIVVLTVCLMSVYQIEVSEPLRSMALIALGYFFSKVPNNRPPLKPES